MLAWNGNLNGPGFELRQHVGGAIDLTIETEQGNQIEIDSNFWFAGPESQGLVDTYVFDVEQLVDRVAAARKSRSAPETAATYLFSPEAAGIVLHEALGHGLEYPVLDKIGHGSRGLAFGTDQLTASDSPNAPNLFGTRSIDDIGQPTCENDLVVAGNIVGRFDLDREYGTDYSSRWRSTYQSPAFARVSNLMVRPTCVAFWDLLAAERQIFVSRASEGALDENSLTIYVKIKEAYLIRRGALSTPVSPFILIAPLQALWAGIVAVSDNPVDFGMYCEKRRMIVPVGQRTPGILVAAQRGFRHAMLSGGL